MIKRYLDKNLFYVSAFITGITSLLFGLFYTLFKNSVFENAADNFLEGAGVLSSYITVSTNRPSEVNYFLIALILSLIFFFLIALFLSLYFKMHYMKAFNLISFLNIIWIIGLIFSCVLISFSNLFTYIILIITLVLYLIFLNRYLNFGYSRKKRFIFIGIFGLILLIIFVLLKLFV